MSNIINTVFYTFSTIAQTLAGAIALLGAFVLYRLQSLSSDIERDSHTVELNHTVERSVRPFLRRFGRNGSQPCIEFWRKAQQRQNTLLERAQSRHMSHDPLGPLDDRQGDVLKRFE